jgi:hypothetical protein
MQSKERSADLGFILDLVVWGFGFYQIDGAGGRAEIWRNRDFSEEIRSLREA